MLSIYKKQTLNILTVFIFALFAWSWAHAELRYDLHNDQVAHGAIEGSGILDTLPADIAGGDLIGIDDGSYRLAPDCVFRNERGRLVNVSSLPVGMVVGFFAVDNTITKLWVKEDQPVEEKSQDIQPASITDSGDTLEGMTLENGVWKN